jgi:glycosyltransferase involved in cell wall biosynthesis
MKISILLTYYNRKQQLINTLKSFMDTEYKGDIEVVIIDDGSKEEERIEDIIKKFSKSLDIIFHRFNPKEKNWISPVIAHNKSIALSTGDILIQQGAECFNIHDIIKHASENTTDENYIVYGCYALSHKETQELHKSISQGNSYIPKFNNKIFNGINGWYQHSEHRPDNLNFCTSISRNNILKLGGFDERYKLGMAKGDRDFILRVNRLGLKIQPVDNIYTYHQFHPLTIYPKSCPNHGLFNKLKNKDTIYVENSFISNN